MFTPDKGSAQESNLDPIRPYIKKIVQEWSLGYSIAKYFFRVHFAADCIAVLTAENAKSQTYETARPSFYRRPESLLEPIQEEVRDFVRSFPKWFYSTERVVVLPIQIMKNGDIQFFNRYWPYKWGSDSGVPPSGFRVVHLASRFFGNRRKEQNSKNDCRTNMSPENKLIDWIYKRGNVLLHM